MCFGRSPGDPASVALRRDTWRSGHKRGEKRGGHTCLITRKLVSNGPAEQQVERDAGGQQVVLAELLRHHYPPAPGLVGDREPVGAGEAQRPGCGQPRPGQHRCERRFAGARRAAEQDPVTVPDGHAGADQHRDGAAGMGEPEVARLQQRAKMKAFSSAPHCQFAMRVDGGSHEVGTVGAADRGAGRPGRSDGGGQLRAGRRARPSKSACGAHRPGRRYLERAGCRRRGVIATSDPRPRVLPPPQVVPSPRQ